MTTAGVVALNTDQISKGLTTDQITALRTDQVSVFRTDQAAALTTNQVAALETRDLVVLTTANIAALSTDQIGKGFTTDHIAALITSQVVALRTDQVVSFRTEQVAALTTNGTAALETRDLAVLTTTQVQTGLSTDQIVALRTGQIAALTSDQVTALTTDQYAALTTDQRPHLTYGTPLVLDLNGNGVSTTSIDIGVQFDIFGTDKVVNTGWVTGGDGLLALDRNHDGLINGGRELFGEGTTIASGGKAENGYMALAEMDTNGDGCISSADTFFADLMVWVDSDSDGISQTSELHTLSSLNITQLDLHAQSSANWDNGNLIGLASSYTTSDGASHGMADVWFATASAIPPLTLQVQKSELSTVEKVSSGVAEPSQPSVAHWQVDSMVDAMANFQASTGAKNGTDIGDVHAPVLSLTGPTADTSVTRMVDAMKQFGIDDQVKPGLSVAQSPLTVDPQAIPDTRKLGGDLLASR
jgi:hypothetical protein